MQQQIVVIIGFISMKTIRKHVFETNSSSTHSIIIETIGVEKESTKPLEIDNVLYPERLSQYRVDIEYSEGGHTLICDTKDKKAALICHWISCLFWEKDSGDKIEQWYSYLSEKLQYDRISFLSYRDSQYYSCDEDNCYLDDNFTEEDLDKLIEIILDDSRRIIDTNIPW